MNASDGRSKASIEKMLKGVGSHAELDLSKCRKGPDGKIGSVAPERTPGTTSPTCTVVIMDEVDRMSGGGITALVQLIKKTKSPVI